MDLFRRDDLRSLLNHTDGPCVSLFMRTTRGAQFQDKKQWKNVLREAEERLKETGVRTPDARDLVRPGEDLLNDEAFWLTIPVGGLAAFLAPGRLTTYRLPVPLDEQVTVGDRFHVRPLLPLLTNNGRFFVLAVSKERVRFLHGTRFTVGEMPLEDVPESQDEALYNTDEGETRSSLNHPRQDPRAYRREEIFRGPGTNTESGKDGLLEYCKRLDRGLHKYLRDERAPLVLATVEYLVPIFKEASGYKYLADEFINGNPEGVSDQDLQQKAWAIVEKRFRQEQERLFALYQQLDAAGTGLAGHYLPQLVPAAYQGQIQYLFLPAGVQSWGRFNPQDLSVELHDRQMPGDDDLLDLAATFTLRHKGEVIALDRDALPGMTQPAAIFWLPLGQRSSGQVIADATTPA